MGPIGPPPNSPPGSPVHSPATPPTATPPAPGTPPAAGSQALQPSAPALPELGQALVGALAALGTSLDAATAQQLLPAAMPPTTTAIRSLLALFVSRGDLGADLSALEGLLQQAVQDRAMPAPQLQAFQTLLGRLNEGEAREFQQLLRQVMGGGPPEARLALALQAGQLEEALQGLQQNLRAFVGQLQGREALIAYFQGKQLLRGFEQLTQRVLERLTGIDLQNLRGLEQAYTFLELPLPPESPLRHVQMHYFDERRGGAKRGGPPQATVAFDLDTTQLGPLWITLQVHGQRCQCTLRAATGEARAALEAQSAELATSLSQAGYANPQITTASWDGDRLRAAAALMARFQGLALRV